MSWLLGILYPILTVITIIHVIRSSQSFLWIYVILFLPGLGLLAYFIAEILPGLLGSSEAHQAKAKLLHTLDPGKPLRQLEDAYRRSQTFENTKNLGDVYFKANRLDEAEKLYRECLQGLFADDFNVLLCLGELALEKQEGGLIKEIRDKLQKSHHDLSSDDLYRFYAESYSFEENREKAKEFYEKAIAKSPTIDNLYVFGSRLKEWGQQEDVSIICQRIEDYWSNMSPKIKKLHRRWYQLAKKDLC